MVEVDWSTTRRHEDSSMKSHLIANWSSFPDVDGEHCNEIRAEVLCRIYFGVRSDRREDSSLPNWTNPWREMGFESLHRRAYYPITLQYPCSRRGPGREWGFGRGTQQTESGPSHNSEPVPVARPERVCSDVSSAVFADRNYRHTHTVAQDSGRV